MNNKLTQKYLVFDVESVGLYGEAFAVAGLIIDKDKLYELFAFHCAPEKAWSNDPADVEWVKNNVTIHPESYALLTPYDVRRDFWSYWVAARFKYPGIVLAGECVFPVETSFLEQCVAQHLPDSKQDSPYPLHDIASIMLASDMDPMATYPRQSDELPAHEPLADARLSVRLLREALYPVKLQTLHNLVL